MDALIDFLNWAWARHHNPLSWYIRPLFVLPFCYFAYAVRSTHSPGRGAQRSPLGSQRCCSESKRCDRLRKLVRRDSLPRWVTINVRSRHGTQRDVVASGCLHDTPNRVHNDLWLVDRHHVTGLSSDHQTSSF